MAVYVDDCMLSWRGKLWCHLVADSLDELHTFAAALGLRRAWFQDKTRYPHYDVTDNMRKKALAMGALHGDDVDIISRAKKLRQELIQLAVNTIAAAPPA